MPYWRLYYHMVWATKGRLPLISADIESLVHRLIGSVLQAEGARIYALNGMEDHIHVVAAIPPGKNIASMVKAAKGSSSHLINHERKIPFKWQPGYGVFTVGPKGLDTAIEYVKRQKEHHRERNLVDALEFFSVRDDEPKRPYLEFAVP